MCKLVGYKRFTSKKNNKDYCVANIVDAYSKRETDGGCVGHKVQELFLPEDQYELLTPADIGKNLHLDYEFSGQRAYLVHVAVEK